MIDHSLTPEPSPLDGLMIQIISLSSTQQLDLRNKLDQALGIEIKDLNLGEELGVLFRQGKELLENTLKDNLTPVNQKAQVFNAVKAQIDRIVAMREKVYSQERFKRFEKALVKIVSMEGRETQKKEFLDLYGDYLEDKGL